MSKQPRHFYEFGPFRLDERERVLLRDGETVAITATGSDPDNDPLTIISVSPNPTSLSFAGTVVGSSAATQTVPGVGEAGTIKEVADGYGWKAYKCCFHPDRSASASVNTLDQLFNCHAGDCPKGNAVQIVMKQEGLTYRDSVERVKAISGEGSHSIQRPSGRSSRLAGGSRSGSGARTWSRSRRSS